MKKFLEVLVDEDGKYHFSTDEAFVSEEELTSMDDNRKKAHLDRCDRMLERLVHDMTEFMWQNKEQRVSQAVRMVAMAEILGCAQPYEHAEEFWSLMMFHTIPQFERYTASIKRQYGFDDRAVNRPLMGGPMLGGPDILPFPFQPQFGKMGN